MVDGVGEVDGGSKRNPKNSHRAAAKVKVRKLLTRLDKEEAVLKLEGMESGSTRGSVVNHVVIQSDASNVPNTVKLNGSNYPLWSKVLEMHIAGRGKKGFVTGSIKEPNEDSADYDAWETENAIVKRWLINSMDPNIMGFFIHLRTAQEVWEEVARKYYDGSDISQIYELKVK
ncbi:unnamed protein product [Prunus armeniaca]|uniref:Retrotransposon Copia-like N-terminal domain-containing protein n=1 Tax=Prunus armeniaca TaxID=36596 RepID=A0A6J5UTH0_PRUAR|nr:unnamed protein product [Prunus armeniaca]